ncbi:SurA N-terminal domain-containing protein [Trebonia sp.]|uniref:protein kinase domain-containing protein n=1 Tax=Trebonia sp. TaxID=2767075 RepID=UPI002612919D|nr:SurA N-terminal domain-containing protein [Trebonia sp.]
MHRDVKPGNVLIDDAPGRSEHAYLSDFGLSKAISSATGITASGVFLGTPDYCAPEQIAGRPPVSARSDQYSLACVAFHMLTGTVQSPAPPSAAAVHEHPPTEAAPRVPVAVRRGALPAETIADTRTVGITAAGTSPGAAGTRPARPARRRRTVMVAAAVAALIVVAVAAWAGLALPGSSPAIAATVGNQKITVASLDSLVTNLKTAAKPYAGKITLTSAEMPRVVLTWLIKFQIGDQMAAAAGVSVTQAQVRAGIADINAEAASAASAEGLSSAEAVLVNVGVTPQMLPDLGRYQAQELAIAEKGNGGKLADHDRAEQRGERAARQGPVHRGEVAGHLGEPAVRPVRLRQ